MTHATAVAGDAMCPASSSGNAQSAWSWGDADVDINSETDEDDPDVDLHWLMQATDQFSYVPVDSAGGAPTAGHPRRGPRGPPANDLCAGPDDCGAPGQDAAPESRYDRLKDSNRRAQQKIRAKRKGQREDLERRIEQIRLNLAKYKEMRCSLQRCQATLSQRATNSANVLAQVRTASEAAEACTNRPACHAAAAALPLQSTSSSQTRQSSLLSGAPGPALSVRTSPHMAEITSTTCRRDAGTSMDPACRATSAHSTQEPTSSYAVPISFKRVTQQCEGDVESFYAQMRNYQQQVLVSLQLEPEDVQWYWQWPHLLVAGTPGSVLACPMVMRDADHMASYSLFTVMTMLQAGLWADEREVLEQALAACAQQSPWSGDSEDPQQCSSSSCGDNTMDAPFSERAACAGSGSDPAGSATLSVFCGSNGSASCRVAMHEAVPQLMHSVFQACSQILRPSQWRRRVQQAEKYLQQSCKVFQKAPPVGMVLPDVSLSMHRVLSVFRTTAKSIEAQLVQRGHAPVKALMQLGATHLKAMMEQMEAGRQAAACSWAADSMCMAYRTSQMQGRATMYASRPCVVSFEKAHDAVARAFKQLNCTAQQRRKLAQTWRTWKVCVQAHSVRLGDLARELQRLPQSDIIPVAFLTSLNAQLVVPMHGQCSQLAQKRKRSSGDHCVRWPSATPLQACSSHDSVVPGCDSVMDSGLNSMLDCTGVLLGPSLSNLLSARQVVARLREAQQAMCDYQASVLRAVWLEEHSLTGPQLRGLFTEQLNHGVCLMDSMRFCKLAAEQEHRQRLVVAVHSSVVTKTGEQTKTGVGAVQLQCSE